MCIEAVKKNKQRTFLDVHAKSSLLHFQISFWRVLFGCSLFFNSSGFSVDRSERQLLLCPTGPAISKQKDQRGLFMPRWRKRESLFCSIVFFFFFHFLCVFVRLIRLTRRLFLFNCFFIFYNFVVFVSSLSSPSTQLQPRMMWKHPSVLCFSSHHSILLFLSLLLALSHSRSLSLSLETVASEARRPAVHGRPDIVKV